MVSSIDLIAGLFTLSPLVIGYSMAIITLKRYLETRNSLLLVTTILFIGIPSPWLGVSTVFLLQLFGQEVISNTVYVFIYAWSIPVIGISWNYSAATLLKFEEKIKWSIMSIISILCLIFLYSIYIINEFTVNPVPNSIFYDSTFTGLARIATLIIIATVLLLVAPVFLWASIKTKDPLVKFKSRCIGFGAIIFVLAAGVDGNVEIGDITVVITIRLMIVIALILLYLGYNTPQRIRNKFSD
jgi:hypothetical protein